VDSSKVLAELRRLGTAQNRKIYGRHGVAGPLFGVSYKNLGLMVRKIKVDHDLACALWSSGNHDARVLATMVADPARIDAATAERWIKDVPDGVIADALAGLVARSPVARRKAEKWIASKRAWTSQAGWSVTARMTMKGMLEESCLKELIGVIENGIHQAPNRTREAMNSALIAIGITSKKLHKAAIAAARRIGTVEVDHGETCCVTPDAVASIEKGRAFRARPKAKRQPAAKPAAR
jgi:3-methyladenine DNA glycosylase AlkD